MGLSEAFMNDENPTPEQVVMKHELLQADLPRIAGNPTYMHMAPEKKMAEAVAEFIRKYIMTPGIAREECPSFYDYFETIIGNTEQEAGNNIGIALKTARNDWARYLSQDARSKVMAKMADVPDHSPTTFVKAFWHNPRKFLQRWRNYYELGIFDDRYVERNLLSSYFSDKAKELSPPEREKFELLQENIRYIINLINGNGGQMRAFLEYKPFTLVQSETGLIGQGAHIEWSNAKPLLQIEKPFLDEGKINELDAYLLAKRIEWYHKRGMLKNGGLPAADADMQDFLDTIAETENELGADRMNQVLSDLHEHNKWLMKYAQDSG